VLRKGAARWPFLWPRPRAYVQEARVSFDVLIAGPMGILPTDTQAARGGAGDTHSLNVIPNVLGASGSPILRSRRMAGGTAKTPW
jgi:hypothetical protein